MGHLNCLRACTHFAEEKTEVPLKHPGAKVGKMQFASEYHGLGAEAGALSSPIPLFSSSNPRASSVFIWCRQPEAGQELCPQCPGAWILALSLTSNALLLEVGPHGSFYLSGFYGPAWPAPDLTGNVDPSCCVQSMSFLSWPAWAMGKQLLEDASSQGLRASQSLWFWGGGSFVWDKMEKRLPGNRGAQSWVLGGQREAALNAWASVKMVGVEGQGPQRSQYHYPSRLCRGPACRAGDRAV